MTHHAGPDRTADPGDATTPGDPPDDLGALATERPDPGTAHLDTLPTLDAVRLVNDRDAEVAAAVGRAAVPVAEAVDRAADALRAGGRLVYVGAGTPGRLGVLDASECPPTFGTDPEQVVALIAGGPAAVTRAVEGAEDDADAGRADVTAIGVGPRDVVVGISASGRTPYVLGALRAAAAAGAWTVAVTGTTRSAAGAVARTAIEVEVGPEVVAGSTRLRAGTAQKLVLNTLSTLAMVRTGKVHGNLMIDLRATNTKLRDRATRLVADLARTDRGTALRTLDACGGSVPVAVVAVRGDLAPARARQLLDRSDGHLRTALAALEQDGR